MMILHCGLRVENNQETLKCLFLKMESWFSVLETIEQLEGANSFVPSVAKQRHCRAYIQDSFQTTSMALLWERECDCLLFAAVKSDLDN